MAGGEERCQGVLRCGYLNEMGNSWAGARLKGKTRIPGGYVKFGLPVSVCLDSDRIRTESQRLCC